MGVLHAATRSVLSQRPYPIPTYKFTNKNPIKHRKLTHTRGAALLTSDRKTKLVGVVYVLCHVVCMCSACVEALKRGCASPTHTADNRFTR